MNSHDHVGALFTEAGYFWPSRDTGPTTHKLFAVDHVFTRGFHRRRQRRGAGQPRRQ